jgi:AraC-like DNA-binding protein
LTEIKPARKQISVNGNTPPLIRLAHPLAFAAFLKQIGAPVEGYFRRQGLPLHLNDPNAYVPLNQAWGLFDDMARREAEDVAWHGGRFIGDHPLSAGLLRKLMSAPTLYLALQRFIQLVNSEASHLRLGLIEESGQVLLYTTGYYDRKDQPGFSCSQAYQLEVDIAVIRQFTGKRWQPTQLGICARSVPPVVQQHFPNCQILLEQPFSYIAIPRSCLHLPARTKPAAAIDHAPITLTRDLNYAETLSLLIRPYLSQGYPSSRFAATLADTSERTLSRRLSQCGTSYQTLVDRLRFDLARNLLLESDALIRDISAAIGFSDPANFSRLFRRVSGISPRQFRRENGDGAN